MNNSANLMNEILALCPSFKEAWDGESGLWCKSDGTYTCHGLFAVLSHHVAGLLEHQDAGCLGALFRWIEEKLAGSNDEVANAATTCFLENLMNRVPEKFEFASIESMLGPESRRFCRAYGAG